MKLQTTKETFYRVAKQLGLSEQDVVGVWEVLKGEPLALDEKSMKLMIEDAMQKYHRQQMLYGQQLTIGGL